MKKEFKSFLIVLFGALLVAIGTYYFLAPSHIAAGGISGISMIITYFFPWLPLGAVMICLEVVLFTIGFIIIGPVFGTKTILCSLSISGLILVLEEFFPIKGPLTHDTLLQLIFGILICGVGIAIAFNENASTGGTDIIAKIINKYTKISIGRCLLIVDILVSILAAFVFGLDKGLYAILGVLVNCTLIDAVIQSLNTFKQVTIISSKGDLIKKFIIDQLDRSATVYAAKGIYHNNDNEVITTVVDGKQFKRLRSYIRAVDPKSFITVQHMHEVLGEGFLEI